MKFASDCVLQVKAPNQGSSEQTEAVSNEETQRDAGSSRQQIN